MSYGGASNTVLILLGDGTGNFTLTSTLPADNPHSIAMADFNGDGDLRMSDRQRDRSRFHQQCFTHVGTARVTQPGPHPTPSYPPVSLIAGDFNGDGKLDLGVMYVGYALSIFLQGIPGIVLSPASLSSGTQIVGTRSNPQPVSLTNTGGGPLKITKIFARGEYSQTNNCRTTVPPYGQCTINVTFRPGQIGRHTGELIINDNAVGSPQTVPLIGFGTIVTLLPSSLNFGDQQVGTTSSPQVATLTNYGTTAVHIDSIHIIGTNRRQFAQTNNCGTRVPAGGNCTISVTFSPTGKGLKTATLEVKDNGGASPQTVALSGTGTK